MKKNPYIQTDCAVIGGGLAGCTAALELADAGKKVDLFVKEQLLEGSSSYLLAGGLAAVPIMKDGKPLKGDSFETHVRETLAAGCGLNDKKIVETCIKNFFPKVIQWLVNKGVHFDLSSDRYPFDLSREGGHSRNRVFHVQDRTGMSIMGVLVRCVKRHPNIRLHENHVAIDLIRHNKIRNLRGEDVCLGVYVYDTKKDQVVTVSSPGVFIATGGLGKVFQFTTNPNVATGDGFAMCYRAGLPLVNMEFIQFHPSVFYDAHAEEESGRRFLLTEALRGAGAILKINPHDKKDFVLKYDPRGSSATRDIVSRAEDAEMRTQGLKHLWLDCTRIGKAKLKKKFKTAYDYCLSKGFDLAKQPVPIIYAVHYSNGGVAVGASGETSMKGCYVIGETAYTGLHGATRLASNSGPECVLYGRLAARHFVETPLAVVNRSVPLWRVGKAEAMRDKTTVVYYWDTVRRTMTGLCGISRNAERLNAAIDVLTSVRKSIREFYWNYRVSRDFLEARNIADAALIITQSALLRTETRACHFREDFPHVQSKFRALTIVQKEKPVRLENGI